MELMTIFKVRDTCAKFSVNRVLFDNFNNDKPTPKNQQTSKSDNAARSSIYALQAGNASFKISLSGGNFVAIKGGGKAAEYWLGNNLISPPIYLKWQIK